MTAGEIATLLLLSGATFVSEDGAGIAAGVLSAAGELPFWPAVAAVAVGIWVGDLGLWVVGRLVRRSLPVSLSDRITGRWISTRLRRHLPGAAVGILVSRFVPGTRLPMYTAAGAAGVAFGGFAGWSALAVLMWTPLLVGTAAFLGEAAATGIGRYYSLALLLALAIWLVWRATSSSLPGRVIGKVRRLGRWEFWPAWLFYAPVVPWVIYLVLTRGARALLAANPGLEDGGFAGESKSRILDGLPSTWTLPHARLDPGDPNDRLATLLATMSEREWSFPIILKPDVGQWGTGVTLVRDAGMALMFLQHHAGPAVAQLYHPGPYEAGIFYYRLPGQRQGCIFSLTDKQFPHVVGDGRTPLRDLIQQHRRFRYQADQFMARHRESLDRIPRPGESVRLGFAGNHAQGAIFLDGSDLITEELTARMDEIARGIDGFFIGRFDVRYRNPRDFMAGRDLAIVELNGVSSEATHIYDPSRSLWSAYRTLFEQWRLVFAIGAENVRRGEQAAGLGRLVRVSVLHLLTG